MLADINAIWASRRAQLAQDAAAPHQPDNPEAAAEIEERRKWHAVSDYEEARSIVYYHAFMVPVDLLLLPLLAVVKLSWRRSCRATPPSSLVS